ncbi:hypothetical protein A7975_21650 [Bacillus sp. FJAT-26390]|nr:hypothetical protein A7975_21650 [Bacillus sp. FJAT-26390]
MRLSRGRMVFAGGERPCFFFIYEMSREKVERGTLLRLFQRSGMWVRSSRGVKIHLYRIGDMEGLLRMLVVLVLHDRENIV